MIDLHFFVCAECGNTHKGEDLSQRRKRREICIYCDEEIGKEKNRYAEANLAAGRAGMPKHVSFC